MVPSLSQSKGKRQTSKILNILTVSTISASLNQETTLDLSVVYSKGTQEPTTPELPESSHKLVGAFTITNMSFTPELANSESENFKELAKDLESLLNDVFDDISGFLYVKVISFVKGSIVCNFLILVHTKVESPATADEFEKVLDAAAKSGKTGEYQITNVNIEVLEQDAVGAVKGKEPKDRFPLKVIGVAAFAGVVALIIVFILYKVSVYKLRGSHALYSLRSVSLR